MNFWCIGWITLVDGAAVFDDCWLLLAELVWAVFEVGVSLEVEGEGGVLEVVAVVAGEVDCLAVVSSCCFCSEVEAGQY